jgi:hypothetical protein
MAQTSSWYKIQIDKIELLIADEINLAGVTETGDGNSNVKFSDRLSALNKQLEKYQIAYDKAVSSENCDSDELYLPRREYGY